MFRPLLILLLFFLLAPGAAPGKNRSVSLPSVAAEVRKTNPQLSAARLHIAEARARVTGAGRLANPTLEVAGSSDGDAREYGVEVGISQAFPITDRLQREKDVSLAQVRVAEAEVAEVERQLVARARAAVIEVLASRELKKMRQEEAKLATRLADFIADAAQKGEGSLLDASQARLGSVQHVLEIRQLDVRETSATGELKKLLGAPASSRMEVTGSLAVPHVPASETPAVERRPDYRAAVLQAEVAEREVELEKSKSRQDFEAGIFAEVDREEDAPEGLDTEGMIGVRVSIPLPFWDRNEGAIEAARAKRSRLAKQAEAVGSEIRNEIATARSLMEAHAGIVAEIDRDLLPVAQQQVELSEHSFRDGHGDLQAVLRARDQQIELRTARLEALREFHLARAAYLAASGN